MDTRIPRALRGAALAAAATVLAGLLDAPPVAAQSGTWSNDTPWPVARSGPNDLNPGVDRPGTLRIMRFNFDGTPVTEDKGNMVGWAAQAAKGNYEQNPDKPTEQDTLELVGKDGVEIDK